ncbi:uncharacterized protein LOC115996968 [Ipomoea triloba]|uniref:uncharacterized protein LOC115996968 n=1 Tax=Ipomoea triloba TaxID=35885 RepID=UPI00125DA5C9|nr:uncharacterized protein LOC115996968 [Ipomoea triloba]
MGDPSLVPPILPPPAPKDPNDISEDLEVAYAALELNDDELEDFTLDQEEDLRFSLVGKLITDKTVKFPFMRDTMATVWRPGKGMAVKELTNNIFLFQFFHEIDVQRILNDGPWSFEKNLLILTRFQPNISPLTMDLNRTDFWIQVHDLPMGFFPEKTAKAIGDFIGKFVCTDENSFDGWGRSHLRIRVSIDVTKPLMNKMRIKQNGGEWSWISFRYERLPHFCFTCGLIGHTEKFCPKLFEGMIPVTEKDYGPWMRAANRRTSPSSGNRWLVSDQVSRYGLRQMPGQREVVAVTEGGGSTMHDTAPGTKDNKDTEMGSADHVSSNPQNKTTDFCLSPDISMLEQKENIGAEIGLVIAEQKRRRVEVGGPSDEPNFQDLDLSSSVSFQKNGLRAGPADQARPDQ